MGPSPFAARDPYAGMADEAVLADAQAAFRQIEVLPVSSASRQVQWQIFDSAMSELARRAMMHVLWKIHEREKEA